MAGGYRTPMGDGLDTIVREIKQIWARLRELERPTGTSLNSLVQQVQAALANINATVTAAIAANSYTKVQIDNKVANPPAGSSVTGDIAASGAISASGLATFNAGVSSADVRARVLTTGYAVQYVDGSGRMGTVPSALRYKQDVGPAETDDLVESLRTVALVRYRYKVAVEELGDDAPYLLGSIAEYFVAAGLGEWVYFDESGEPDGINYERLTIPLIAGFQSLDRRIAELENRTD